MGWKKLLEWVEAGRVGGEGSGKGPQGVGGDVRRLKAKGEEGRGKGKGAEGGDWRCVVAGGGGG